MDDTFSSDYEEYTSETGGTSTEETGTDSESEKYETADGASANSKERQYEPNKSDSAVQLADYDEMISYAADTRTSTPNTAMRYSAGEDDLRVNDANETQSKKNGLSANSHSHPNSCAQQSSARSKTKLSMDVEPHHRQVGESEQINHILAPIFQTKPDKNSIVHEMVVSGFPAFGTCASNAKKRDQHCDGLTNGSGSSFGHNAASLQDNVGSKQTVVDEDDDEDNTKESRYGKQSVTYVPHGRHSLREGKAREKLAIAGGAISAPRATRKMGVAGRRRASAKVAPPVRLEIELHSNWGGEERMGISELQFLDGHGRRVQVAAQRDLLSVTGVHDLASTRTVSKLFSANEQSGHAGWTCPFNASPVSLKLLLYPTDGKLSAIKVRNYGSSVREHSTGVRNVQVRLDGRLVHKGELPKGNSQLSLIKLPSFGYQAERRAHSAREKSTMWLPGGDNSLVELSSEEEDREGASTHHFSKADQELPKTSASQVPCWFGSWSKSTAPDRCAVRRGEPMTVQDLDRGGTIPAADRPSRPGSARFGRRATSSGDRPSHSGGDTRPESTLSGESPVSPSPTETSDDSSRHELETSLEESWSQLEAFNLQQRGRLVNSAMDDVPSWTGDSSREATPTPGMTRSESEIDLTEDPLALCDCDIPELPECQQLTLNIKSTWGDIHYVGLNGLEVFGEDGLPIKVTAISAEPADINVLPEYQRDPRVVANLVDGVNRTRDDMHLWLAPFTPGGDHLVRLDFGRRRRLAMLRIWNYNKSRCHSFRGARHVEVHLDRRSPFCVEVARACGDIFGGTEAFGDTILFTTDDAVLERVSHHDASFPAEPADPADEVVLDQADRPRTADADEVAERPLTSDLLDRPLTTAGAAMRARELRLVLTSSWGADCLGLTALELISDSGDPVGITVEQLSSSAAGGDLARLVDEHQLTCDPRHMWLVPWSACQHVTVTIRLVAATWLSGLRVWNYNSCSEEVDRGVRTCLLEVDGRRVGPADGFLLRPGPGHLHYNCAQMLDWTGGASPPAPPLPAPRLTFGDGVACEEYEAPEMPRGFVFQLQLNSSWGDPYYVGLTGLQLFDQAGRPIALTAQHVATHPDSVNVLDGISHDVRTPDKLVDGVTDSRDGRHSWLAPLLPDCLNRVYVVFDRPQTVSMVKLWNYAKTPSRGVREFGLLVDDLVVYNSVLGKVAESKGQHEPVPYHTVLFTSNREIARRERHSVCSASLDHHRVRLLNNMRQPAGAAGRGDPVSVEVDQSRRPHTSQTGLATVATWNC